MVARVGTLAFDGVDARQVDVEVQLAWGGSYFMIVSLGDRAVGESRERVRAAFAGLGLALPSRRIVVNLGPADAPKEGSHYDLPIALGVRAANLLARRWTPCASCPTPARLRWPAPTPMSAIGRGCS
jgi:magnesium chelatase family protein